MKLLGAKLKEKHILEAKDLKIDIKLSEMQLKALWELASNHKNDFAVFKSYFSDGLFNGLSPLIIEKKKREQDFNDLVHFARTGNYEKFTQLFEKGFVNVNYRFISSYPKDIETHRENTTFLLLVITNDKLPADNPKTEERKKLVTYLLEKGADMYVKSHVPFHSEETFSCWDLTIENASWKSGYKQYLNSFFNRTPRPGANIFPILEEWHSRKNEVAPLSC